MIQYGTQVVSLGFYWSNEQSSTKECVIRWDGNVGIGTRNASSVISEKMRIKGDGNVGIGYSS